MLIWFNEHLLGSYPLCWANKSSDTLHYLTNFKETRPIIHRSQFIHCGRSNDDDGGVGARHNIRLSQFTYKIAIEIDGFLSEHIYLNALCIIYPQRTHTKHPENNWNVTMSLCLWAECEQNWCARSFLSSASISSSSTWRLLCDDLHW